MLGIVVSACGPTGAARAGSAAEGADPAFRHELGSGPVPWTAEPADAPDDDFTFAIIGDVNGGERDRIFDVAVAQLAMLQPDLILSIGDLIDGVSENPDSLGAEWNRFDERVRRTGSPFFYVPGNHDATAAALRSMWGERYGPLYYHFIYEDVLFLVLDSEDHTPEFREDIAKARNEAVALLYSGDSEGYEHSDYFSMPERQTGQIGPEQAAYFERVIAEHPDVRWTFLFLHKPVWQAEDEPEWARIEAALAGRPYSVFAGHYHIFSHEVRDGHDYTQLATTGGSQSGASDMAFDQVSLVHMTDDGPSVAHLRMDGILDATGHLPAGGDTLCMQASRCGRGH